jgi:CHASE2 domain-containing sensor protein
MRPTAARARPSRAAVEWWVLTALLLALVLVLARTAGAPSADPVARLDAALYDVGLRAWARAPRDEVVVVAIDDASLAQVGRWPWRRAVSALLLERIHAQSPRAIGIDVLFVEPADGDEQLARAAGAGDAPVVLPVARHRDPPDRDLPLLPIPRLGVGRALGHVELSADADGLVRGLYLQEGGFPALAALLARPGAPAPTPADAIAAAMRAGGWERSEPVRLGALRAPVREVSAAALMRGDLPADTLRGRIVLVGATARGLGDNHATPLFPGPALVTGVALHAAAVSALLEGRTLREPPQALRLAAFAALLVAVMAALYVASPRAGLLLSAAAAAGVAGASVASIGAGWWPAPGALLVALSLAFPLWSWRRLHAASVGLMAQAAALEADDADAGGPDQAGRAPVEPIARRLRRLEDAAGRIRALNRRLAQSLDELRAAQHEREETLRFLSHDLRSPTLAILSLLGRNGEADLPLAQVGAIEQLAHRTLELADGFMQLARAESQPLAFETHDLLDLAVVAADACWQLASVRGLRIVTGAGGPAPEAALCRCDAWLIQRALINLIDNALRFGPPGSVVAVGVTRVEGGWRLTVDDSGPGIAPAHRLRIFEAGWRGRQPDDAEGGGGAGLGLAFVAAAMARHGGRAVATDRPGGGARIELQLPDRPESPQALHSV